LKKTIFITGSTDGIGLETAKIFITQGHHVLLHGRNPAKLKNIHKTLSRLPGGGGVACLLADLSSLAEVEVLAKAVAQKHTKLDVLINNAGIFHTTEPITKEGLDMRFVVNTIAPYLLTQRLLPLMEANGRVINLSSAAQSSVDPKALSGQIRLSDDFAAYAQSKLALNMWSRSMALTLKDQGPVVVAVNPGSMLGTKMVKEGFGVDGHDVRIGAEILVRAALSDEFATASGLYFDNDSGQFASAHLDQLDPQKSNEIVQLIEAILADRTTPGKSY
jgi:NAD(P)-dependent dehydrogenase (short-subunit alcohol dehydrogenase family)